MKTKYIFLIILITSFQTVLAQQFSISGKAVDQTRLPVEFLSVKLFQNDSILIAQVQTDSTGHFSMYAASGIYQLVLKQSGTELASREIVLLQDTELGEIVMNESFALETVTVAARKKLVEQKADRLVFNIENSTYATGGTALDALKVTPMVSVQNERVSILGKGEVLVMIDDRLHRLSGDDLSNFLKSIPADNIRSIEVITAPPAKYDAEGSIGLINIRLKTARRNAWNASIGTSYIQKIYASGNMQGLFSYKRNKLSIHASVNTGNQQLLTDFQSQLFYPGELWSEKLKNRSRSRMLGSELGMDYKLNKKWKTGVRYLGSFSQKTASSNPLTSRLNPETGTANSYISSKTDARNQPGMNTLNWYHSIALDSSGKSITIDLDYFSYRKKDYLLSSGNELDKQQETTPGTFFSSDNTNLNKISNHSAKMDISLPYSWATIELGGKVTRTFTNNDLTVYGYQNGSYMLNTDQSNFFSYREYNEAIYFSLNKKLNKKWETQIGLRMEATQTEGYSKNLEQKNQNNYIRLFPTAYATYAPNDKNSFSMNYSRRIRRPDFDYLNPFVIRTNPYYYSEGNPFLKPSFIDNVEFSYLKDQKWGSSVYFSRITDFSQELSIIDASTNITQSIPMNYADVYQAGLSTYYNFNKFSRWNNFTGLYVNYQSVKSKTDIIQSTDGFNGYFYTSNDFTLNKSKTIFLGLNYAWQLPGRYQIFSISSLHILDVSVKFLFLDKKLSLTLIAEDLLNGQRPQITYLSNGVKNTIRSYNDTMGFRISVSYKLFGKNDIRSNQRNTGNEDERNRIN